MVPERAGPHVRRVPHGQAPPPGVAADDAGAQSRLDRGGERPGTLPPQLLLGGREGHEPVSMGRRDGQRIHIYREYLIHLQISAYSYYLFLLFHCNCIETEKDGV